jgi:hypothetical protein
MIEIVMRNMYILRIRIFISYMFSQEILDLQRMYIIGNIN